MKKKPALTMKKLEDSIKELEVDAQSLRNEVAMEFRLRAMRKFYIYSDLSGAYDTDGKGDIGTVIDIREVVLDYAKRKQRKKDLISYTKFISICGVLTLAGLGIVYLITGGF